MPKPNVALLEETLTYIRDHPEEWNQNTWGAGATTSCGTPACFAGRAIVLSGKTVKKGYNLPSIVLDGMVYCAVDGKPVDAVARDLLRLTNSQAVELFSSGNVMQDLECIVKDIINESQDGLHA